MEKNKMTTRIISHKIKNKLIFSFCCLLCTIFMNCATIKQDVVKCDGAWFNKELGIYSILGNEFFIYGEINGKLYPKIKGYIEYRKEKVKLQITHFYNDNWETVTGPASVYSVKLITENKMIWVDSNEEIIWNRLFIKNE